MKKQVFSTSNLHSSQLVSKLTMQERGKMILSRLAFANLKRKKGAAFILIIFILLATALLNIGISIITKTESVYRQKEKDIKGAQFVVITSSNKYKKEYEEFVFQDDRVDLAEKEEVISMSTTKNNINSLKLGASIFNLDKSREIAPLIPIEEDTSIPKNKAIYVPIMLKSYNLSVGDNYELTYKGKTYSYIVAGFFETNYYGTVSSGYLKYYLPNESYETLFSDVGRSTILSARFKAADEDIEAVSEEFAKELINTTDNNFIYGVDCMSSASMESDCMMFIYVVSFILISFALIVCIIIMAVIYNRVVESIDDHMQNIGVLESIGYTAKQIMFSITLEYLLLSIVGFIAGIFLSYAITPILSNYLSMTGIIWRSDIHLSEDILCFCIVLISIGITAFLGTIRIIMLPPVKALNKSNKDYQFSTYSFPLHKGIGSIHYKIGINNLLFNKKSNFSFMIIVSGGIFAIGLALVMYMNFALDTSGFMKMSGYELSDLQISVTEHTNTQEFQQELLSMEEIRKTNLSDLTTAKVESHNVLIRISDNFDAMETLTTYEGDMPRYDDEIAITGIMCKSYHKKIGDTVTVTAEGRSQEYYITGIFQTMNNNGYLAILPLKGFKKLSPQYEIKQIDIYLNEGVNKEALKEKLQTIYKVAVNEDELSDNNKDNTSTTEFGKYSEAAKVADKKIAKLLADYGVKSVSYTVMLDGKIILSGDSSAYKIKEITDVKGYASGQLKSYASMMSGLVTVIAAITFLIIGGILSITIKSLIRKKREEYGIYKAMGYTTKDLVFQLSISFVIISILGTIIGIIATVFLSNKVLKLLFVILGITRLTLAINIPALIILGACMVIYLYLIALVKAYKIKKITAYYLLTE